jgi:alpha-L-fucosidase 2
MDAMDLSRRGLLQAGMTAALLSRAGFAAAQEQDSTAGPTRTAAPLLWYNQPAREWTEALPLGNGSLGAMVFGGIKRERLQLNEDTLWSGSPYGNVNPRAKAALPRIRELIFAGRYAEAEALADAEVQAVPMREMAFQDLGDLFVDLTDVNETSASDYRRSLDLDSATAVTRFTSGGVSYTREIFISPVHQMLVMAIHADGAPLSADIALATGQRAKITARDNEGDSGLIAMRGENNEDRGIPGGLRFTAQGQALAHGGTIRAFGPVLQIRGAQRIELRLTAATSFVAPGDVSGDPDAIVATRLHAAQGLSLEDLRSAHVDEHRRLFRRVSLTLPQGSRATRPTDQRLEHAANGEDPSLAALYFQFGRYLLISSSRPGTQPANLQGIWNDNNRPPWQSKYTININTEMNYWPAQSADLPECFEPLVDLVEQLAISGAKTARDMYGARGWVAHHNTDLWRASGPIDHARTGLWPTGGAWLAVQLWDHWDYLRDDAYLRRIFPLMAGSARFFLDTLVRDPRTGFMVTNPSNSPENDHGHGSTLCAGPAMDSQILRDLFARTAAAARHLRRDEALAKEMEAMAKRLPPDRIGKGGQLQEWQFDWDADAPDPHHRHVSHLYALYPGHQIDPVDTPDLAAAARVSLDRRGDDATGWGLGWRLNLWARLRDKARAHKILIDLLSPGRTYPNMFDAHPPFQIDGNFGGAAGIIEMLAQSDGSRITLLPALPASWPEGSITGIRLRGACKLDLVWAEGRLASATLFPELDGARIVHAGAGSKNVTLRKGRAVRLTPSDFIA